MRALKTMLTVIGAVTVLVLALNTVAYAATGGKFFLGKTNKAGTASTLKRTTPGPALNIVTKPSGTAPFTVTSNGRVTNLNADRLDGQDSSAFEPRVGGFQWHDLALGSGWTTCYTGTPQYAVRQGIAYFRGSLCGGADSSTGFTVPAAARPARTGGYVYLPVDQCNGATGRIAISTSDGGTYVISDPGGATAATCFVSLEGISYPIS